MRRIRVEEGQDLKVSCNGFNVSTESGATGLLRTAGNMILSTSMLNQINEARANSPKEPWTQILIGHYQLLSLVAMNASPDVFEEVATKAKLTRFIGHFKDIFSELTTKPIWTKTGVLSNVDDAFLQAIISFCRHAAFIKLFVRDNSKSGLKVLADLCAARNAPDMFGAPVAESVVGIVYNIMFVVGRQGTEVPAIVKVIESSGMLSQVIRAITVPPNGPDGLSQCLLIIDWFYKCRRQKEASFRISIGGCPNSCPFWT